VNTERNMRNRSEYVTMNAYRRNEDIYVYMEQDWIPFWHSKCIGILYVTVNLPSELAQAVSLLSCIWRSPFQLPHGTPTSTSKFFSDPPRELRYIALSYANSLFTRYSSCPSGLFYVAVSISGYTASGDVMDWWIINCKGSGRRRWWPDRSMIPAFAWRDYGSHENPQSV
jgi:hypothetical protein